MHVRGIALRRQIAHPIRSRISPPGDDTHVRIRNGPPLKRWRAQRTRPGLQTLMRRGSLSGWARNLTIIFAGPAKRPTQCAKQRQANEDRSHGVPMCRSDGAVLSLRSTKCHCTAQGTRKCQLGTLGELLRPGESHSRKTALSMLCWTGGNSNKPSFRYRAD